jgi:hypothetical protein
MTTIINAATSGGLIQTADTSGVLALQTASTTALTVTAAQLVGIGTASPSGKLHVSGGSNPQIVFDDAASRTYGIGVTVSAMSFYDVTGAAERMRITSAGNVGIGLTNPSAPLNPAASNQTDNTKAALFVSDGTTTTKGVAVGYNSTPNYGFIQSVNKGVAYTFLSLQPEGANVLVGTTTNNGSGGTLQVSNGITFPATQSAVADANTLDDYEEGTWTPVITPSSGSLTAYTSGGYYVKVGKLVMVTGYFTITTAGTASGLASYTGLPFALSGATNNQGQLAFVIRESQSTGVMYAGYAQGSSTSGALTAAAGNGSLAWTNTYTYPFAFSYYS